MKSACVGVLSIIIQNYIVPVILCGCETWSPTLREEHKLSVFENRELRKIFQPKQEEITDD